jgi:polyisoprenoid-binding protein YceI
MGADFFNLIEFPMATFIANISQNETGYLASGTLTIKDIAVPVTLPFTLDLDGDTAEMSGILAVDRRIFEIGQSVSDEASLGFGVGISINLTATRSTK